MKNEIHKALLNSQYLSKHDLSKLSSIKILIIGAGGTCHPFITYACSSGFRKFTLVDNDIIEESNLSRQFLFRQDDIGKKKVDIVALRLKEKYSDLLVESISIRADEHFLFEKAPSHHFIIDCSDNFLTRYLISDVSKELQIPLVMGFGGKEQGHVFFTSNKSSSPCYECIFPRDEHLDTEVSCQTSGIVPVLLGMVGSYMNMVLLNYALKQFEQKFLTVFKLGDNSFRQISVKQDHNCTNCY
ncbi:MAG: HesA/MoeB/ThiF family protein [Gammaproteobacteria bacterium]